LSLVFADSPSGGGTAEPPDASGRRNALLHKARIKKTRGPVAGAADTSRLLEEVASEANLAKALLNVVRNKGAPGVDGQTVEEAEAKAPSIIARLRHDLLAECYRPGDVRRVWLPKPGGGQRGLGIPNVVDRTVQQAVLQVLEPIFEPTFHPSSHGFRPNRGAHTAIAEATEHLKAGYQTVVDLDLAKFFDRVHHQRLLARIATRVKDQRIIALIRLMLQAVVVLPDGARIAVQEGTPQGGPLSPLLSNIVLDELDRELARRGLRFVRYADDSNIFVRSERAGQRVMASIRAFLEGRMRLQVNEGKSGVRQPHDVHFLGFSFRISRRVSLTKGGTTTAGNRAGDDAPELGSVDHYLHGGDQSIPDQVDAALPAMHGRSDPATGRDRRAYPPPNQGDHRPTAEARPLPIPTPYQPGSRPLRGGQLRVLRPRGMGEVQSTGYDSRLSDGLVRRTDGLDQGPLVHTELTTGIGPALAGALMYRSKEPDAGPHVRLCVQ
jgi:group II intron reverse transcriptase/maturase